MSVQEAKRARLELRLSVQELQVIKAAATARGLSLSDYVRTVAIEGAQGVASESRSRGAEPRAKDSLQVPDAPSPPEPTYRCPNDCTPWRPKIPGQRCPTCSRLLVPA